MRGNLQECMAAHDGRRVDWTHIVEAATGDVVRAKMRNPDGSADAAGAWSENVGDRMPEIFSVMLPKEERDKLAGLGGEHWLRAQLAKTAMPPPLPNVGTAQEMLRAVAGTFRCWCQASRSDGARSCAGPGWWRLSTAWRHHPRGIWPWYRGSLPTATRRWRGPET